MKIIFMKCGSSSNVLNKTFTNMKDVEINRFNDFKIVDPFLLISNSNGFNVNDYNYISIPELERGYFITNITRDNSKIYRLNLMCDVLSSFKNEIKNCTADVQRGIKDGDFYDANLDKSVLFDVVEYVNDFTFVNGTQIIVSVVGG